MATIDRVGYEALHNLGNYENERICAEASAGPDETPEAVLATLRSWVVDQAQLGRARQETAEADDASYIDAMLRALEGLTRAVATLADAVEREARA